MKRLLIIAISAGLIWMGVEVEIANPDDLTFKYVLMGIGVLTGLAGLTR